MVYPYLASVGVLLLLLIYSVEQDLSGSIYSSLPAKFKTPLWFSFCMLQEANQFVYSMFSVSLIFQLHILLPTTLNRILKKLPQNSTRYGTDPQITRLTPLNASRIIGQIRVIQIVVNLFNLGHRNVIYALKLACIGLASVNGYAAIAWGTDNVIFTMLASVIANNVIFFYGFVYEKAFAIPDGVKNVKRKLRVQVQACRNVRTRKYLCRRIDSVPSLGLKVGEFHVLERESTPIFVDYVVKNIVNLLVTL